MKLVITITCHEDVLEGKQKVEYEVHHDSGIPVPLTQVIGLLEQTKMTMFFDVWGPSGEEDED